MSKRRQHLGLRSDRRRGHSTCAAELAQPEILRAQALARPQPSLGLRFGVRLTVKSLVYFGVLRSRICQDRGMC